MNLQAMDSSHVSLCSLLLKTEAFESFRCDRNVSVGLNLANMTKIVKCAGNDDAITIKTGDKSDTVSFVFEVQKDQRNRFLIVPWFMIWFLVSLMSSLNNFRGIVSS